MNQKLTIVYATSMPYSSFLCLYKSIHSDLQISNTIHTEYSGKECIDDIMLN